MSAIEVAPQRLKPALKTRPVIAALPKIICTKKETGQLGPVSGASAEMRLHRSQAPLTRRIVRRVSRPRVHLAPARVQRSEAT
jgi:hypothetical protein